MSSLVNTDKHVSLNLGCSNCSKHFLSQNDLTNWKSFVSSLAFFRVYKSSCPLLSDNVHGACQFEIRGTSIISESVFFVYTI